MANALHTLDLCISVWAHLEVILCQSIFGRMPSDCQNGLNVLYIKTPKINTSPFPWVKMMRLHNDETSQLIFWRQCKRPHNAHYCIVTHATWFGHPKIGNMVDMPHMLDCARYLTKNWCLGFALVATWPTLGYTFAKLARELSPQGWSLGPQPPTHPKSTGTLIT